FFFFSSRRRHTRFSRDWSSDVCSSDLEPLDESLRSTARRYVELHWRWFDRYATEQTHWLAPDNVQFDPAEVVAMRTSPTNIGLRSEERRVGKECRSGVAAYH